MLECLPRCKISLTLHLLQDLRFSQQRLWRGLQKIKLKPTPWLWSASELCRPSDHRLSAKYCQLLRIEGVSWSVQRIPTVVNLGFLDRKKRSIFWEIMLCSLLKLYRRFEGTCRLYLQGWRVSLAKNQHEAGSRQQAELRYINSAVENSYSS
jgi:hypothetical protein